jgi:hypothetical protein
MSGVAINCIVAGKCTVVIGNDNGVSNKQVDGEHNDVSIMLSAMILLPAANVVLLESCCRQVQSCCYNCLHHYHCQVHEQCYWAMVMLSAMVTLPATPTTMLPASNGYVAGNTNNNVTGKQWYCCRQHQQQCNKRQAKIMSPAGNTINNVTGK